MPRSSMDPETRLQVLAAREKAYARAVKGYAVGMFKRLRSNRELLALPVTLFDRFAGKCPPCGEDDEGSGEACGHIRDISVWGGRFGLDRVLIPCCTLRSRTRFRPPVGGASLFQAQSVEFAGAEVLAIRTAHEPTPSGKDDGGCGCWNRSPRDVVCEILGKNGFPLVLLPNGHKTIRECIASWKPWPEGPFGIASVSGKDKLFDAFDAEAAKATAAWDELLGAGRRLLGLGLSDAEHPWCLGTVFSGIVSEDEEGVGHEEFPERLRGGRIFFSNGPLIDVKVNGVPMGGCAALSGKRIEVSFRAADARGILSVRCVGAGGTLREFDGKGRRSLDVAFLLPRPSEPCGVRCEAVAMDGRRAFSNPVFLA